MVSDKIKLGPHGKYCKRILKQYGRHIKSFEERLEDPIETKRTPKGDRRLAMPYFLKKGSKIDSHDTLVFLATTSIE